VILHKPDTHQVFKKRYHADNPCLEEDGYRIEVLIILRKLERLDKDEYSEEDRSEAEDLFEQRRQEELMKSGEDYEEDDPEEQ